MHAQLLSNGVGRVMKNIPLLIALLSPGAALAAACDMSELRDIDRQYLASAPACVASGDYGSAACTSIGELNLRSNQAAASMKALRCDDSGYVENPDLAPLRLQVISLQRQTEKAQTRDPKFADNGSAICTTLMADIASKYDLLNLKLIPNKADVSSFYPIVPCSYEAIRPTVSGNIPVVVQAQLNQSNKRYRISIR
ncbi:hypothetical protein C1Y23_19215 [Pseudomonas sp. GW460-12]|nr:hypothetical protein C1Y23_19215 [Pseudomonas sp. GW460-12]PMX51763.1 hypothetical protein C1Y17_22300 [Pseudomonas sp. MPR-R2A6]PMX87119.1 hypothetical protein C1Y21_23510 [Pseudomonas sp. MPR-R2A3]PNA31907.1 hypothetical protein C1Y16_20385 [Pseudomonas sp. MPR-ANB1]PNA42450.1 hypothetical protein C1Y15_22710 [Pseudomonas sp. MPR-LB5]PNA71096.1 hypothetical protein C1Y19_22400 [Pseudomonas sp. MPR-LB3]